ncbi:MULTISPECIES: hypothetical protein [unclassified Methylobacterium]|nr:MULTISPECIES: hypothetical protein [unclassified Methylobacterium]
MHGRDEIVLVEESLRWFLAPDFTDPTSGRAVPSGQLIGALQRPGGD